MYRSTKSYGHDLGLSVAFRQHRASSHCRFIHGYALAISLVFEAKALDNNNWVLDFGAMKTFKEQLVKNFDHKLLVASDDPKYEQMYDLGFKGLADVLTVPATGCEAFARQVYDLADQWLEIQHYKPRVRLVSVEVREHGANSAIYLGEQA